MKSKLVFSPFLILLGTVLQAQSVTQNIRGQVIDEQNQSPLPGVNVYVQNGEQKKGAVTDFDGYYLIEDVKVGRVSLGFSFIGYETVGFQNLELIGSKELILNVSMRESTQQLEEVVLTSERDKARPLNERANVSARTFSIEETQRFAGSNQDVSRMASSFAGVQRANDATNDIVIRGNSPTGLIWRLEGIDIPNPNHFGGIGATGGPVSMLNSNVLSNSDFFTSAFPSDYGNGISGVFDLSMRNGNYEEHEFLGQIGFNGFELGAEGPINRDKKSSYLINYRYSTLEVLSALGVDFGTGTAIPKYQDLNMKLHFPSRKRGTIDVFAMGGISAIEFLESENEDEENFYSNNEDLTNKVNTGVVGVSHQYLFSNSLYSKLTLALTATQNLTTIDTLDISRTNLSPVYRQDFSIGTVRMHGFLNKKINVHHSIRLGALISLQSFNLLDSGYSSDYSTFVTYRDFNGEDVQYQPYLNWQYRITDNWEMNTGLHSMILKNNGNAALEPRFGMTYRLDNSQSLNIGYGLHHQVPGVATLYDQTRLPDGSYVKLNENLEFSRAHHFVLGYDKMFANRIHFKTETYYQNVSNAVIERRPSAFSSLNYGSFNISTPDSVKNGGIGYNYGLDITLEKFMDKGFYFMSTLSLFESRYQGSDEIWRNTAFNGNYVFNVLGGKEFVLKKGDSGKRNTLTLDTKFTYAGGQRYTPLDLAASILENDAVFDESNAFGAQYDPYLRLDLRIGYKMSGSKFTQEWALDIQNVTNQDNPFGQSYNAETQEAETTNQLGIFPMVLYRITF
tara:strand:+ start:229 stop:2604 length:2376 start_codon:yes stop_codon:yes gene_type:complete